MHILIIGAYPKSILSFRGPLIQSFLNSGHQVTIMTADAPQSIKSNLNQMGVNFIPFDISRNGLNPFSDIKTCWQLTKAISKMRPDKILAYTIKPVIWGGIAARLNKINSFYAMITGLGFAFEKSNLVRSIINRLVKTLYKFSLQKSAGVIFQNEDNRQLFIDQGIVPQSLTHRVYGSGIDLDVFDFHPLPQGKTTFLLIARLLGDKGIREYVAAAKYVKQCYADVCIQLLGPFDPSPDGISPSELAQWQDDGLISYLGEQKDVKPYLQNCHVYVLPSYHEGLPRTVLEAMATGRPILTTNVCGCKDTVIDNKNGVIVPAKNVQQLAEAMLWFVENPNEWLQMGKASREFAEKYFDVRSVNTAIINIMFKS
ncbi:glycosyltransferase family 4 protein [Thalassotalea sp. 1_MG-2023]|uniref:glycosyltransferase family 4 protein n=1 Tax=Thalassotalea sp. 1_MG-2023 TaxID=3062680 RepID=UPI0026E389FE|nr:glycosyltransferase family 4 protein [Thalassotalea sp. 1_MG-2023]MDO6425536.1 glycosyltransferase family 4 protein [Thalassotalea sp. 1_MG-2023]